MALRVQLREVQTKAADAAQSAREERLKVERARMEAEMSVTQLKVCNRHVIAVCNRLVATV